jgi:hypothetical protein
MNTFLDLLAIVSLTFLTFVSAYVLMFLIGLLIAGVVLVIIFYRENPFAGLFATKRMSDS